MTNKELLEEIRLVRKELGEARKEIGGLKSEFYIFKGKAFGFIALLSFIINVGASLLGK